jgi:mannose-1-phosphate guanylyltransferase
MQKHERRAEFWFVAEGYATVYTLDSTGKEIMIGVFGQHQDIWIPRESWHRLVNETKEPLRLIELQYGEECSETDIMRR